ncbi:hypothetical protein ACIQV3_13195 [Streptomyces sp. NPDC099050]|uniref:hypothetical protein n=1 Tax=Streptomyces sp. NPDC099050 TaxID=3366100 RepID=UPI0037FCC4B9
MELVPSPLDTLTPVFLEELAEVAREHPWIALFFDTYERTGPMLDSWLRDVPGSERHGEFPANVLVTLAGQSKLAARTWEDWHDLVTDCPLEAFTEAEARLLLTGKGVTDERVVEEEAAELFGRLRSMPFVTDRSGHCRHHEVVRGAVLRLQRRQSPIRWERLHTRLADALRRRREHLEEAIAPAEGWWSDESRRGHRLQEACHRLCADPSPRPRRLRRRGPGHGPDTPRPGSPVLSPPRPVRALVGRPHASARRPARRPCLGFGPSGEDLRVHGALRGGVRRLQACGGTVLEQGLGLHQPSLYASSTRAT